ncbi:MAG TPA: hypothetical protein VHF01_04765 [Candidatus Acidoferrum sp.]|nr:hypothetical protein [Candidatus Acidoferrum sp.]
MKTLELIRAGQTLFLSFSIFEAALTVEGQRSQRVSIAFSGSAG